MRLISAVDGLAIELHRGCEHVVGRIPVLIHQEHVSGKFEAGQAVLETGGDKVLLDLLSKLFVCGGRGDTTRFQQWRLRLYNGDDMGSLRRRVDASVEDKTGVLVDGLEFLQGNVLPIGVLDQVLDTIDNHQGSITVPNANVSRLEPTIRRVNLLAAPQ